MATHLTVPKPDSRPGLTRSRSSSSPIVNHDDGKEPIAKHSSRPAHNRSRSYISPTEKKPTPVPAATFPSVASEKPTETSRFPRLHLPGRHHHHSTNSHDETKAPSKPQYARHRYTQSEAQQYNKKGDSALLNNDSPGTPWATTPASSSSEPPNDILYPASRGAAIPSLMRITSARSNRPNQPGDVTSNTTFGDPKLGLRRRATSDPRTPAPDLSHAQTRPAHKTPIEHELDRADHLRQLARASTTEDDIKRKDTQLQIARRELKDRATNTTRSASDLMRQLDDAQDTLSRTTESLVDTISSFSNLSDQSAQLISNFEHESRHLDHEILHRITRFRTTIVTRRSKRVEQLEERGQAISKKAEDLGRRLENCRTIVMNWEEREMKKRKAWRGVWVGIIWGVAMIFIAVLAGIASWKAVDLSRSNGTAMGLLAQRTVHNKSYDLTVLENLNVPDDVKEILVDIDTRARKGHKLERPAVDDTKSATANKEEIRGLRLLDEL